MASSNEAARLREEANRVTDFTNPPLMTDNFTQVQPKLWPLAGIDGAGIFKAESVFHAGEYQFGPKGLTMYIHTDENWNQEDKTTRYNNVALFGMRGFRPTVQEDVVMKCVLTISKPFYGSTGCVFEPVNMVAADGKITHFDIFGVSVLGPESNVLGGKNLICINSLNYLPVDIIQIKNVDIYQTTDYEIRLTWQDDQNMTGTISVNGVEKCRIKNIPIYTVEVQIWNDNYKFSGLSISYSNSGEKWVLFHEVSVWAEPRSQ
jgi:hypothetical protein